jgi:hypothetical protein
MRAVEAKLPGYDGVRIGEVEKGTARRRGQLPFRSMVLDFGIGGGVILSNAAANSVNPVVTNRSRYLFLGPWNSAPS